MADKVIAMVYWFCAEVADAWKTVAMSFVTLQKLAVVAIWRGIWDEGRCKMKVVMASRTSVSEQLEGRWDFDGSVLRVWKMGEDEPGALCVGWMGKGRVAIALEMLFETLLNWGERAVT